MHIGQENQQATPQEQSETQLSETETCAETKAFSEALLDAYTASCSQDALKNMDTNGIPTNLIELYRQLDDVTPLEELV